MALHISFIRLFLSLTFILICSYGYAQLESFESRFKKLEKQGKSEPVMIQFIHNETELLENISGISQIILLRHGEPALDKKGWRNRNEAKKYIKAYDSVGIYPPQYLPLKLNQDDVAVIFTSTLYRSISTAELLFQRPEDQKSDALFREFERKIFSFPNMKLPLKWWLTGSRLFWFMGFNKKDIESFSEAKRRAKEAASFLEQDAIQNGKTLLVSHGLLNHYLAKYLKKNGWSKLYDGGKGYMAQKLFVKYDSQIALPIREK